MGIDKLTLQIPFAIVNAIESFDNPFAGTTIEAEVAYHDLGLIPHDKVIIQVYPLTRSKTDHGKNGARVVESAFYVAINRRCKPTEKKKLGDSIQYAMDVADLFDGIGSDLYTFAAATMEPFSYKLNEDETFLWFPSYLHQQNKFVCLIELRYNWRTRVAIS